MIRRAVPYAALVPLLLGLVAAPAGAQEVFDPVQSLDFDRPESWAMKYFASVTHLTGLRAPRTLEPGEVELGFEAMWVPQLSEAERTVGFEGTKTEDLNRTEIFGRPRLSVGLPRGFVLGLSYVPPIEVFDIEPHLFAADVSRVVASGPSWSTDLRLYGQWSEIEGDFTCSEQDVAGGDDPVRNPFGCEQPSNDQHTIRALGLQGTFGWREGRRVEPYAGLAVTYLDMKFQIDARYSGIIDRTLQRTEGATVAVTAGLDYALSERLRLSAEAYYSPLDVVRPPATSSENDALLNVRSQLVWSVR